MEILFACFSVFLNVYITTMCFLFHILTSHFFRFSYILWWKCTFKGIKIKTKRKIGSNIHTHFHTSTMSVGVMSANDINPSFFINSRFGSIHTSIYVFFRSIWNYTSIQNLNQKRYYRIFPCIAKYYVVFLSSS